MAKRTDKTVFAIELELNNSEIPVLESMVDGEAPRSAKIKAVAEQLLSQQAGGGMMLVPEEMSRIREATGIDPNTGEDLIPFLSAGSGILEGKHTFQIQVDPAHFPGYEEAAFAQGRDVKELFQDVINQALDDDWMGQMVLRPPDIIRFTQDDRAALTKLLGEPFATGTELAELVKKALLSENDSAFADLLEGTV